MKHKVKEEIRKFSPGEGADLFGVAIPLPDSRITATDFE